MIINLNKQSLTKLSESDLIQFCELNEFKPEKLKILDLSYNNLKEADFLNYKTRFVNLSELILSSNNIYSDFGQINQLKKLEKLDIKRNFDLYNIRDFCIMGNIRKSLKYLDISQNYNLYEIDCIKYLENLEEINIGGLDLRHYEKEVFNILINMKTLKKIKCSNTFKNKEFEEMLKSKYE